MECDDCKNYEPRETGWTNCSISIVVGGATYSNDGSFGRDNKHFPRLKYFVQGYLNGQVQTRAGFLTREDAELFLAALPEEER